MADTDLYIGLISGTSVDGVDCALVQFDGDQPSLIDTLFLELDQSLRELILQLCSGESLTLTSLGEADTRVGRIFAEAVKALLEKVSIEPSSIKAIGSHGQTIWHQPLGDFPFTTQIGDPNIIAERTGIQTVADFRRRDMAAGGQGAPLAPLLHRNCFRAELDRVVINIGGISNITVLPAAGPCLAFDTGPGNVLMDYWIDKNCGRAFDENGEWAKTGVVNTELLPALLAEDYFGKPHPKSTGRELFNGTWLEEKLRTMEAITAVDVQRTLAELTAVTITNAIDNISSPQQVFVCGGGAHNNFLMERLDELLDNCEVASTSKLGMDPDWVEAIAFAWLAKMAIERQAVDTAEFTGANDPVKLGGIYQA
ncbi:MAG: anhydro-N-acetylmuramic acid kinase [Gammaproteobacteria bacterium]|jgi:anhydro-N-acetylmuramic acid kinase|nr:anhydro-N-acetylmuramic acid kinase [Gammaproteobacteria bacterium]MDP6733768.1 anhydro-N-acetylmuramic acid kinase [Gammaproteobacteria bacterium]|tara:strand:+ start:842 stop:1945 length:1104 start_codon:yes stop_codon:yes gene_type:complete